MPLDPPTTSPSPLRDLVRPDRVHRSLYRDPAIFELEMANLFGRAWLYVGHESQIPEPGDFLTLTLARQPVVLARHKDRSLQVLFNRCGHRGAIVVNEAQGNTRSFRCCYHGWTFATDGALVGVPLRKGYPPELDLHDPELGMVQLPRVASYRGFIFASLAAEGPDLVSFLGPTTRQIDDLIDLSPTGELSVTGGVHRYEFAGNWKLQLENLNDMYHPFFSHASTLAPDGKQFKRRSGDGDGPQLTNAAGKPNDVIEERPLRAFDHGHSYCGAIPFAGKREGAAFTEYRARLVDRVGEARADAVLNPNWHNVILYPNLCLQSAAQHIRVINPIAVDRTEISVYPILLGGAPDEINRATIRHLNLTHSAASLIQTDDLEAFARIQDGLKTEGADWLVFARGTDKDVRETDGSWTGTGTGELPVRNQYRAWLDYLTGGAV